jgi:hypothetical protein
MSYNAKALARQTHGAASSMGPGHVSHQWLYRTTDALETVEGAGYFNGAVNRVNKGDVIDVVAAVGTTPVMKRYVVSAKTGTVVTISADRLPAAKYTTGALEGAAIPAASVAGAETVAYVNTGTTPGNLQFPTAADLVAAIPGAHVGQSYLLKIRNGSGSANTATITTNTGITLTGTMTIAQNVTRDFIVTLTSLTAVDVRSVGISAAGA